MQWGMRSFLRFFIILTISVSSAVVAQQSQELVIVYTQKHPTIQKYQQEITQRLPQFSVTSISTQSSAVKDIKANLVIAMGMESLDALVQHRTKVPIISLIDSRAEFEQFNNALYPSPCRPISAIFIEPNPEHQLQLVRALFGKDATVAVLTTVPLESVKAELQQSAKRNVLSIQFEVLEDDQSLNHSLKRIAQSDVLLAIPNEQVYNTQSLRNIILTSYRNNQAIIGFSRGMVSAGALASTYSEVEDLAETTQKLVEEYTKKGELPASRYVSDFHVTINEVVARSLNLVVEDAATVENKIKAMMKLSAKAGDQTP